MSAPVFTVLISLLVLQRVGELVLANSNLRWATARGGVECGTRHYRWVIAVHTLFFLALILEWRYRSHGWNRAWPLWLALLLAAQIIRLWSIHSLGRYWNTRIVVIPGMRFITRGPYRFIRHPNYLVVAVEMLVLPVLCGAYVTAALFFLANAAILARRIPMEERAIEQASGCPLPQMPRFLPRLGSK